MLVPKRVVPPEDIEDFFNATGSYVEEKRWLQKTIARHVSEWSDQVDWVRYLIATLTRVLPSTSNTSPGLMVATSASQVEVLTEKSATGLDR